MAYAKIRPRRGTLYEWSTINPVIAEGEFVIEAPASGVGTGLCKFKIGDGVTAYNNLPYAFDAAGASSIYGGDVYTYNYICLRTGTTEEWTAEDPVLLLGEIVYDSTENAIKVGDGVSTWTQLDYIGGSGSWEFEGDYDFGDMDEEVVAEDAEDYDFGDDDETE